MGDSAENIARAIEALAAHGVRLVRQSLLYETEPVDMHSESWFLNSVVEAETDLTPQRSTSFKIRYFGVLFADWQLSGELSGLEPRWGGDRFLRPERTQGAKARLFSFVYGPTKQAAEKLMFCIRARL